MSLLVCVGQSSRRNPVADSWHTVIVSRSVCGGLKDDSHDAENIVRILLHNATAKKSLGNTGG